MNNFYVYSYCYPNGIPFYIGKGMGNRCYSDKGRNFNFLLEMAIIRDAGREPIVKILFNNLYEDEAFVLEKAFINFYGRANNKTGILTNLTDGGEGQGGRVCSNETKQKISKSLTGKTHSEETKRKMSLVRIGDKHPLFGLTGENNPNYRGTRSDETKRKMSEAQSIKLRKVSQYSKEGALIRTFLYIREAEKLLG